MALTETTTAPAGSTGADRLRYLDGYRALAALAVVLYHVSGSRLWARSGNALGFDGANWASRAGGYGVAVFFVLSGFLLYRPFVTAHLEGRRQPRAGRFLLRRAVRIYPAYWVALTVSLLAGLDASVPPDRTWIDTPALYLLVQNYVVVDLYAGLDVAWTLCVEMSFSLLLPLLSLGIVRLPGARTGPARVRLHAQLTGLVLMVLVGWAFRSLLLFGDLRLAGQPANWVFNYLDWFAVGMALAVGAAWRDTGRQLPAWLVYLADRPIVCWLLALQLYWLTVQLRMPLDFTPAEDWQLLLLFPLTGASAGLLLLPATVAVRPRSAMSFLDAPVLVFLGAVSYGIYLWHIPVLRLWSDDLVDRPFVIGLLWVTVVSVAMGFASHLVVERPAQRWRRRWERWRPAPERG